MVNYNLHSPLPVIPFGVCWKVVWPLYPQTQPVTCVFHVPVTDTGISLYNFLADVRRDSSSDRLCRSRGGPAGGDARRQRPVRQVSRRAARSHTETLVVADAIGLS